MKTKVPPHENPLLAPLNEQQRAAVLATEGRVRIIAGAGSGKTRVIAHRYAYLVNQLGIDPGCILCLTFTNKAAAEMRTRIGRLVERGHVNDYVCTIHSFCVRFLRKEIFRLGYPATFTVLDEEDRKHIGRQVLEQLGISRQRNTVAQLLDKMGRYKYSNRIEYIERYLLPDAPANPPAEEATVVRFLQMQLKLMALDFDDLVYFTLYILGHFPEVRESWLERIDYVQVDEVQDCSDDDWEVFTTLSQGTGNLCIVGDPDQSIYEWRGGRPDLFVDFKSDTDITLTTNYRSVPPILTIANEVITNNHNRIDKTLVPHRHGGKKPVHYHGRNDDDESNWIAKQIEKWVDAGENYRDIAILYRASFVSRSIEQALLRHKIKYQMWGGVRFFERKEIKDLLAYLQLVVHGDDLALQRVINVPPRRFGKKSLERLTVLANRQQLPLYDTLRRTYRDEFPFMADFVQLIETTRQRANAKVEKPNAGINVADLAEDLLLGSGLKEQLRKDNDEERLENITELLASMNQYDMEHEGERVSLDDYLQDIALYTNADYRSDGDTVKLMTIHQAKGLEFPIVIIAGLVEGTFPNYRSIRERLVLGEEEERRLMYVAITRARDTLVLTESEGYNFAEQGRRAPSRYIGEIADEDIRHTGDWDPRLLDETRQMALELEWQIKMAEQNNPTSDDSDEDVDDEGFKPGDAVFHDALGDGIVLERLENGSYRVQFNGVRRTIRAEFLSIPTGEYD